MIFAVLSIALVGMIGIGIDYTRLAVARTELQDRLDAALLAGARNGSGSRIEAAEIFFDNNTTGSITKVAVRRFEAEPDGVSGMVSGVVPTTLSSVLGIRSFDVTATGRATAPRDGRTCILGRQGQTLRVPDCTIRARQAVGSRPAER